MPRIGMSGFVMLGALWAPFVPAGAQQAGDWPNRPIELIVLNAPGGASDVFGRALAHAAQGVFSQPIVVINQPGGGGATQMAAVRSAAPDGYTIGVNTLSHFTSMQSNLAGVFSPDDFSWIALLQEDAYLVYVSTESDYDSFADVIAAHADGDGVTVGGFGPIGSTANIAAHVVMEAAGIEQNWVSFDSSSATVANVLGGHVEIAVGNPGAVAEFVEAGRIRVLGVLAAERSPALPEVPTFAELGLDANPDWTQIRGIFGPAGIPMEIQQAIAEGLFEAVQEAEFQTYQRRSGIRGLHLGPAEYAEYASEATEAARGGLQAVGIAPR